MTNPAEQPPASDHPDDPPAPTMRGQRGRLIIGLTVLAAVVIVVLVWVVLFNTASS